MQKNSSSLIKARVLREKTWHDKRFTNDNRALKTKRFYRALRSWYTEYEILVFNSTASKNLEVGSGLESLTLKRSLRGDTISIDISPKAISYLRHRNKFSNVKYLVADAHKLDFPDESFGLIFTQGVLHHLELSRAIPELHRLLQKGGKVVFAEPLSVNPLINLYRYLTPNIRTPDEKPLAKDDIRIIKSAFGTLNVKYYGFFSIISSILLNKDIKIIEKLDNILLNRLKLGPFLAWACIIYSSSINSIAYKSKV